MQDRLRAAFLDFVAERPDAARVLLVLHRGDPDLERDAQRVQGAVASQIDGGAAAADPS